MTCMLNRREAGSFAFRLLNEHLTRAWQLLHVCTLNKRSGAA
jgi:hypothetical protein